MPSTRATLEAAERQWALSVSLPPIPPARPIPTEQWAKCQQFSEAYGATLADPDLQEPVTPQLLRDARQWLRRELGSVIMRGYWPLFVDRESLLPEAVAAFRRPRLPGEHVLVPITSLYNDDPHPVWSKVENLLFRFVHDYHHALTGADDSFFGELAVTRHILTPTVRANLPLARFLASEPVGQSAYFIHTGIYPQQVIASTILPLI